MPFVLRKFTTRPSGFTPEQGTHGRRAAVAAWLLIFLASGLLTGCLGKGNQWFARNDQAVQLAQQARAAEESGREAEAEKLLQLAIKRNPADCDVRLELSELLLEHGSVDEAEGHLRKLVTQNPGDARPMVRLAELLTQRRYFSEAEQFADAALRLDSSNIRALLLRGQLYEIRHRDEQALTMYFRARQIEKGEPVAGLRLAGVLVRQGEPRQAGPLLRELVDDTQLTPAMRSECQWLLGKVYVLESRWDLAEEQLNHAAKGRELSAADWYLLGRVRHARGDAEGARLALSEAKRMQTQPGTPARLVSR